MRVMPKISGWLYLIILALGFWQSLRAARLERIVHDQQIYMDNGCRGRHQGK